MTELRELNPDFRDLLLALAAEHVDFVVVGALVRNKQAAGRPKDLADVARLKR